MNKLFTLILALGLGYLIGSVVVGHTVTMSQCFPVGGGACVRVAIPSGTDPGPSCVTGEIYLDTDETVDTNCTTTSDNSLCLCTAANTWTELDNN